MNDQESYIEVQKDLIDINRKLIRAKVLQIVQLFGQLAGLLTVAYGYFFVDPVLQTIVGVVIGVFLFGVSYFWERRHQDRLFDLEQERKQIQTRKEELERKG